MTADHDISARSPPSGRRATGLLVPTIAVLMALAVLIGLGFWQWSRLAWKEELIATIEARSRVDPIGADGLRRLRCDADGDARASCEYTPVRLTGRFDHDNERHIFIQVPMRASGLGGPGYWVMTPFAIDGGGRLYVNRGFVPTAHKVRATRAAGDVADTVEIVGQLRVAERRGRFSGADDPAANIYFVRDPVELGLGPLRLATAESPAAGTWPPDGRRFYVDMTGPPPPSGLPLPLPLAGQIAIPNRHLEYALTWWALAATLLGVHLAFVRARLRS